MAAGAGGAAAAGGAGAVAGAAGAAGVAGEGGDAIEVEVELRQCVCVCETRVGRLSLGFKSRSTFVINRNIAAGSQSFVLSGHALLRSVCGKLGSSAAANSISFARQTRTATGIAPVVLHI